jgi:pheromone shutdown protein TraB
MNWMIKYLELISPSVKRVLVDQKDEELFRKIDKSEGKRVVAVVN